MAEEVEDDEKTEEATPRRRREAREKGQVALSSELLAATSLLASLGLLLLGGSRLVGAGGALIVRASDDLAAHGVAELDGQQIGKLVLESVGVVALPFLAIVAPLFLISFVVGYGQVGFQIAPSAIAVDWTKINPAKGLKRMLSARSLVRTALAAAKIVFIAAAMGGVAWGEVTRVTTLASGDLGPVLAGGLLIALRAVSGALGAIAVLALADFGFQRWQHTKDLRMSKKELREEWRTMEGDPHLKARIRQVQREMATRRMMDDVPKATVVVTNPTHYSVALRYERDVEGVAGSPPIVVAKGVDHVARRIREIANEAGVPCIENPPLARGLHATVEIGDSIPEDYYKAVAEVLTYVWRLQGDLAARGGRAA